MPAHRPPRRQSMLMSLGVLIAVLTVTSACGSATTHLRSATGTSTPNSPATATVPTSSHTSAYVGAGDRVYALDSHSGAVRWTFATGHGTSLGGIHTVSVMNGTVFAHGTGATPDGHPTRVLYALEAATGSLRWMFRPPTPQGGDYPLNQPSPDAEPVAIIDGIVYLFAPGPQVPSVMYAVDLLTGKVLWDADTTGGITASVDDTAVYITQVLGGSSAQGPTDATLTALDRHTGAQRWQLHGIAGVADAHSGDLIYATSFTGFGVPTTLLALNRTTGATQWRRRVASPPSVVVVDTTLFASDTSGVSALDAITGQQRWSTLIAGATYIRSAGAMLCLTHGDQRDPPILGLQTSTGVQLWSLKPVADGVYFVVAGVGAGACYAYTNQPNGGNSTLSRVDAATGATRWTIDAGGQVFGSISVLADVVLAATETGSRQTVVKALAVADGSTLWQFTPPDNGWSGKLAVG